MAGISEAYRKGESTAKLDSLIQQQMGRIISQFERQFAKVEPEVISREEEKASLQVNTVRQLVELLKPIKWSFDRLAPNNDVLIKGRTMVGDGDYDWEGKIMKDQDFEITQYRKDAKNQRASSSSKRRFIAYLHKYTGHSGKEGAALIDANYEGVRYTAVYCQPVVELTASQAKALTASYRLDI